MYRTRRSLLPAIFVAVTLVGAAPPVIAQAPVTLAVAGRNNDAVSVAAQGQFVAVSWGASTTGGMDVFNAISRDGGATFAAPVRVNLKEFDARVGGEQPPHVVLVPRRNADPEIVVVWTAKRPEGSRLLTARSTDGGVTFGATTVVPGADAAGNRGWESVAAGSGGSVYTLWLDHRGLAMASHTGTMQHGAMSGGPAAPKPDPVEQAGKSALYISTLDGRVAPKAITNGVCYCCKTSITTAADGSIYSVWRHVFPGDLRDIAFTVSRDGGRTFAAPVRVSEDHWEFDGCPDNGPAIAVDGTRRVHVAWPTPADGKNPTVMALFYAVSRDGRTFTPRVRIPTDGPAGHVQINTLADGSTLVGWEEMTNGGRTVKLARGTADAAGRITFTAVGQGVSGKYPAMAVTSAGAVMAYTQQQSGSNVITVARIAR